MIVRDTSGGGLAASFSFRDLANELNRVPNEVKKKMTPALRTAAQPIFRDAQKNASWSRRIPRAMTIGVRYSGKKAGVRISVSMTKAPHARAFEGITARAKDRNRAGFRHPVFSKGGRRQHDTWVMEPFRPYLLPAIAKNRDAVGEQISTTVNAVLKQSGFR